VSVSANPSMGGSSNKSHVAVWLSIVLVLILLIAFAPTIVSFAGAGIASALGCEGTMQIRSPCLLSGDDVSETLTTMIYLGYLSFVTMPVGAVLLAAWGGIACIVVLVRWRRRRGAA